MFRYITLVIGLAVLATARPRPLLLEKATILESRQEVEDSYDYVIVGAGTAGLTLADRLTEDGKCKPRITTELIRD
jgi:radical SAM superfamily enzyme YgiQ (UPF0313 family)